MAAERRQSNGIGNLLLHLAGNVRRWIVSGVAGVPDTRRRQAEFDGLYLLGEYRGLDPNHLRLMKSLGLDYTFAYCWHVQGNPSPQREAQVRALESLGRHYVSDAQVLEMLRRLFAQTPSWSVQTAIAGILIRADRRSIASAPLLRTLIERRQSSPDGNNMVDALIDRLQSP